MTAANKKSISAAHVFVDSTHVKASANKWKFEKKIVRKETRAYQGSLQEEINQDRENHGKKPFPPDKFPNKKVCLFIPSGRRPQRFCIGNDRNTWKYT